MKKHNITKNEVTQKIHDNLGIPIIFSEKIINYLLDIISEDLKKNNIVKISGFGTFKLLNKSKRVGRNPKTKEEYEIKSRNTVSFYPSSKVKKLLNNNNNDER